MIGKALKIKIKNIKITDKNKKIEITFPDVEVEDIFRLNLSLKMLVKV